MTDFPDDPAALAPPVHESRRPLKRLSQAMASPDSYGLVLLLIVFTYVFSVSVTATWAASLVVTVQIATVWVALRVSEARRGLRRVADLLLLVSAIAAVINLVAGKAAWSHSDTSLLSALLYLVAPFSITRHLLFRRQIDVQTILGALDIYLLIGMLFAFIYHFLGVVQPGQFFGTSGDGTIPQDLFFSFTTLTTTGYGNLVPAKNPGQTLAVLEMLVGQLFLVIAVAKVISAYRPVRFSAPDPPRGQDDADR